MSLCVIWGIVAVLAGRPLATLKLTPTQVNEFHREGVLVVRGLLTPSELRATRKSGHAIILSLIHI